MKFYYIYNNYSLNMTLTQLKYMIAVAETGNFTSASKKVCYTTR